MGNPCCSCKLPTRVPVARVQAAGRRRDDVRELGGAGDGRGRPCALIALKLSVRAGASAYVCREFPRVLAGRVQSAAAPVDDPYCGCKL